MSLVLAVGLVMPLGLVRDKMCVSLLFGCGGRGVGRCVDRVLIGLQDDRVDGGV